MRRVGRTDPPAGSAEAVLWAARGEYEPFQFVLRANAQGLREDDVSITDLTAPDGSTIARSNFTLYREHYVRVTNGSPDYGSGNRPTGTGWYTDALIPFINSETGERLRGSLTAAPFQIDPYNNQPFWVDLYVPPDTAPGAYSGSITAATDRGKITLPISLTVWRFSLPTQPSLKSAFGMHRPTSMDRRNQELLLRHKLMPNIVDPSNARSLVDELGLNITGLWISGDSNRQNCTMAPAPSTAAFSAKAAQYPPDLSLYVYSADEIDRCPNLFSRIRQWGGNAHSAHSSIKNLVTVEPFPELLDDGTGSGRSAVDIWVLLPKAYDDARAKVAEVLRKGDEVWSYAALVQDPYSPKWEIDFAPINFRIQPGFISQSLGITGLLYWRVDLWTSEPWQNVNGYSAGASGYVYPGEGMMIYPGSAVGLDSAVPSIRLKWVREGVEDYEYIEMLKRLGRADWVLQIARGVGADWTHWTRDPAQLMSARIQMGEELDRLAGATPAAAR